MASVQWMKQTMQYAGSLIKHNGQKERAQYEHANVDIDKSRSHDNFFIGCSDYEDGYNQMKNRVEEVDREYPPLRVKKDRIVCCSLYTPCPQAIENKGVESVRSFFEKSYTLYQNFLGKENVHGMTVHGDERHNYIDCRTGQERTSLFHGTALVSAYSEWTEKRDGGVVERKGINGKHFETRSRLNALNTAMCEMVRAEFGIEYNTGELVKSETAEVLKEKSKLLATKKELEECEEAVERAKQLEAASLAQIQENSDIIAQQDEQINDKTISCYNKINFSKK